MEKFAILFSKGRDGRLIGRLPSGKIAIPVKGEAIEHEFHECHIISEKENVALVSVGQVVYCAYGDDDPEEVCKGRVRGSYEHGDFWHSFVSKETKEKREAEKAALQAEYEKFCLCEKIRDRLVRKEPVSDDDLAFLESQVTEGIISTSEEARLRNVAAQMGGEYESKILVVHMGRIIKAHYVRYPDGTWNELTPAHTK